MVCSCTSTDGHGDDRSLEVNTLSVFYARSLRVQVLRGNVGLGLGVQSRTLYPLADVGDSELHTLKVRLQSEGQIHAHLTLTD